MIRHQCQARFPGSQKPSLAQGRVGPENIPACNGEQVCTLWIKPTSQDFHMFTQAALNSRIEDRIKAATQFADTTENVNTAYRWAEYSRVGEKNQPPFRHKRLHNMRTSHAKPDGEVGGVKNKQKKKSPMALANAGSYHNQNSFHPGVMTQPLIVECTDKRRRIRGSALFEGASSSAGLLNAAGFYRPANN